MNKIIMNDAMTMEQAELKSGLTGRLMSGDGGNDFLRCQLGWVSGETRPNPKNQMPMPVTIFHVAGYGETWEAAVKKAKRTKGR